MIKIFSEIKKIRKISETDLEKSFLDLGFDSLELMRLVLNLNELGLQCKVTDLYRVESIATFIYQNQNNLQVSKTNSTQNNTILTRQEISKYQSILENYSNLLDAFTTQEENYTKQILKGTPQKINGLSVFNQHNFIYEIFLCDVDFDLDNINKALSSLIKRHDLLRAMIDFSGLNPIFYIFDKNNANLIFPILNLSNLTKKEEHLFLQQVIPIYYANRYKKHRLSARFVILKLHDGYKILCLVDSFINTARGQEIIVNDLHSLLQGKSLKNIPSYTNYIAHIANTIDNYQEIYEKLNLKNFISLNKQFAQKIKGKKIKTITKIIPLSELDSKKNLWIYALELLQKTTNEFLDMDSLPIWIKYNIGKIGSLDFSQTIGDLEGYCPIVLTDSNLKNIPEQIINLKFWLASNSFDLRLLTNHFEQMPRITFDFEMPINENFIELTHLQKNNLNLSNKLQQELHFIAGIDENEFYFILKPE